MKYNYNDDHIYVLFNNEWIKTTLNCSLKSSNWFLRGDVNNTDIFGYPMFNPRTNGISNASTYITDGYLRMDYRTDSMCEVAICSQKTIPVGIYSSITVKFLESHYLTTSDKFMFTIGFYTTNSGTHTWGGVLFPSRYSPSSLMQTITYDLTEYNNNGVEMYLEFFGITNTKIYEVTFNK